MGGGRAFATGGLLTGTDNVSDMAFNSIDITSQLSNIKVYNVTEETMAVANGAIRVKNQANI